MRRRRHRGTQSQRQGGGAGDLPHLRQPPRRAAGQDLRASAGGRAQGGARHQHRRRRAPYNPRTAMESFLVAPVSRASAEQRACRSGRPGQRHHRGVRVQPSDKAMGLPDAAGDPVAPQTRRRVHRLRPGRLADTTAGLWRGWTYADAGFAHTGVVVRRRRASAVAEGEDVASARVLRGTHAAAASASQVVGCSCQVRLRRRAPTTRRRELPCSPREGESERGEEEKEMRGYI
uniref:Uncharacterized protein n=1 Tax=Oryza nivara TaxID=4536 RepID=A0A0E0FKY8_ORYNI